MSAIGMIALVSCVLLAIAAGQEQVAVPERKAPVTRPEPVERFTMRGPSWFASPQWLAGRGMIVSGSLTWDGSKNLRGGLDTQGAISRYLLDINLSLDLERWLGWPRWSAFVDFQHHDGRFGDELVGDFQVFSNIDAPPRTQIPGAWAQWHREDERLRIKFGKLDANTEFAYTVSGGWFLNSSMGVSPTIFVIPTYPDPAGGLVVEWETELRRKWRFGFFDGVGNRGVRTGTRVPTTLFTDLSSSYLILETEATWGSGCQWDGGRAVVGAWCHTGQFEHFDGRVDRFTHGWYGTLDKWLYSEHASTPDLPQGLSMFLQLGWADHRVSDARWHVGSGFT